MTTVGDPISTATGEESLGQLDWQSPRDSRLAFSRFYSSSETYISSISGFGYGMAWWSNWEKKILQKDVNSFLYYDDTNNWLYFSSTSTSGPISALSQDHPFSMAREASGNTSRLIVSDGKGRKEYYARTSGSSTALLNEVKWADGYDVLISRDTSARISALTDNRGQRAEFTWTVYSPNTRGTTVPVVSQILVDLAYNGTTLAPDVSLTYSYVLSSYFSDDVLLSGVVVKDVASTATLLSAGYSYDTAPTSGGQPPSMPAKLVSISDGRLNSSGLPFQFEQFQYAPDIASNGLTRAVKSGRVGFTTDTVQVNQLSSGQVEVVNPLGKKTNLTFTTVNGRKLISQADGVPLNSTIATTASLGYTPNSGAGLGYVYQQIGRNGSVTNYTRDSRGLVLTKTEDATGSAPRVTSYTWNTTLRLPLTRTTVGLLETYTYTTDGQLLTYAQKDTKTGSPTLNQVRTWTYTYTTLTSGLKVLTSVDGPLAGTSDTTAYTYTTNGDLATATDPNGLVTTVLARNDQGQPTSVQEPNGNVWSFTMTGWVGC